MRLPASGERAFLSTAWGTALLAAVLVSSSRAQEFSSSVVGTDYDFIVETDPSTFVVLEDDGEGLREMPDKTRPGGELMGAAICFRARFDDGTSVRLHLDADFGTREAARAEAGKYLHPLGKLPTSLRRGVERLVVHASDEDATAFSDVGLIVVYSSNASKRISTHDLEETIFHESVHAAWDEVHANSAAWLAAQESDGGFVTRYAQKNPRGEDLAESALFAYTLVHHPERFPPADAARIRAAIPARIAYVEELLPADRPIHYAVPTDPCRVLVQRTGQTSDLVSNVLLARFDYPEARVRSFLSGSQDRYPSGRELFFDAASEFEIEPAALAKLLVEFVHVNCDHGDGLAADEGTENARRAVAAWLASQPATTDLSALNAATLAVLLRIVRRCWGPAAR